MKKILILLVLFTATSVYAQDMIVKKDGTAIKSKILEVGTSEIRYKKYSNQDGPLYSIDVSDVLRIYYENGDKESFENVNEVKRNMVSNDETITTKEKEYKLKAGTLIPLQNANYTKAAQLSVGQNVLFRVARDVEVDGVTVIPYGTPVRGKVYEAKRSSWWGTKGKLGILINEIELSNGVRIPLSGGNVYVTGNNRTPLSVLLFLFVTWPACFITGSKAELPAGYEITAMCERPAIFTMKNGELIGKVDGNYVLEQSTDNQKYVILKLRGSQKIKAVMQSEDDIYYFYTYQSNPQGRTYKIKKKNVKEIVPIMGGKS